MSQLVSGRAKIPSANFQLLNQCPLLYGRILARFLLSYAKPPNQLKDSKNHKYDVKRKNLEGKPLNSNTQVRTLSSTPFGLYLPCPSTSHSGSPEPLPGFRSMRPRKPWKAVSPPRMGEF